MFRMRWMNKSLHRFRSLFRKGAVEQELDQELQFHIERQIAENIAAGMTAKEARRAAMREFGGVEQVKEGCRDERRVNFFEVVIQDVCVMGCALCARTLGSHFLRWRFWRWGSRRARQFSALPMRCWCGRFPTGTRSGW
jgi:hypothetical protein